MGKYISIKQIYNIEPPHEIPNNLVCVTSKGSDQPAHTRSLISAFDIRFLDNFIGKLATGEMSIF